MNMSSEEYSPAEVDTVRRILIESAGDPPEHLVSETLFAYVDRALDRADAEVIESHLDECRLCREDVEELRALRGHLHRNRVWQWVAAAIVVPVAAAALMWLASTRNQPRPNAVRATITHPVKGPYASADWQQLVSSTIKKHQLPSPAIVATLRGAGGPLRGQSNNLRAELSPAGVVIDTVYPRFRWPATAKAFYRITIASGDEVIATVSPLGEPEWQCNGALPRDRTYTWQVEVRSPGGASLILPTPADPPAMFHIISDAEHRAIALAAERHPNDHLLLAALFARSGMDSEARNEMRRLAAEKPKDLDVQRLVSNTLGQQ
jgi:hypothetical protein